MNERKIAVAVNNENINDNVVETIEAIYEAGFRDVFIQWYNEKWEPTQEKQLELIRGRGLNVIFAHLGYQNVNDFWADGKAGDALVDRYKNDIRVCKEHGIPMVIMHLTRKKEAPIYNSVGLGRLQKIVDYADSLGMKIAFENMKIRGYLEYVIDNLQNENVGVCFDAGHYHAHFNDEFNFSRFKNKIFAVHLHDNGGNKDEHLMPFDGTIDWEHIAEKLNECNYDGPVTLELTYGPKYANINIRDFYKQGFLAGQQIKEMLEKR
ncbi:MAG: sugar phosphate isomerase/epimerase family protein [Candidatus Saccharibacteria bacterium]|nr:sugar phosphate isomerase/epimerase family protein [Candidatus Saccharibacteria bacterium]